MAWLTTKYPKVFYFWGDVGSGRTHLLNAALNRCPGSGIYIPLKEMQEIGQNVFDNLEIIDVVAIDHIDIISGNIDLETSVFHFIDKVILSQSKVIISGRKHPGSQGFNLSDLASRLCSGLLYKVNALDDDEKKKAIIFLSSIKGMNIKVNHLDYIFKYFKRDMKNLIGLLEQLDQVSMSEGKPVTLAMIKRISLESNLV